jgi:hypothetical protein
LATTPKFVGISLGWYDGVICYDGFIVVLSAQQLAFPVALRQLGSSQNLQLLAGGWFHLAVLVGLVERNTSPAARLLGGREHKI